MSVKREKYVWQITNVFSSLLVSSFINEELRILEGSKQYLTKLYKVGQPYQTETISLQIMYIDVSPFRAPKHLC